MTNTPPLTFSPISSMRTRTPQRAALAVILSGAFAIPLFSGIGIADASTAKTVVMVQLVDRPPYGQMLASKKTGASLYIDTSGPCTGSCLTIWPPLLLPKGKKVPAGITDLGTVKFGHRLQVTYKGQPLYSFASDSGTSVNGEGVGGFVVAAE